MADAHSLDDLEAEVRSLRLEVAELRASRDNFGLVWKDRREAIEASIDASGVGLRLSPDLAVGTCGSPSHLLIEGENLAALAALRHCVPRKVDVVYIDPPYNTGNTHRTGFTYSDRFRTAEDVERHSTWLSMMRRRLELLRELLAATGVILLSIDDNEVHHLRVLCDQIFGEHNFIAQMVWDGGNVKNSARFISGTHEYVLIYARSMAALTEAKTRWREPRPGVDLMRSKYQSLRAQHGDDHTKVSDGLKRWAKTAPISSRLKVFTHVDARGMYTYADLSAPGGGGTYEILHPSTGLPCKKPSRGWAYTEDRIRELIADDRVIFGADESSQPMRKLYLEDKTDQVRRSILSYPARTSTHLIERMLGRRGSFNNPKNLDMIVDLLALVAPSDALVLDCFAGSGTTGHAVLELNARDGGTRRFLLVTNNERDICHTVTYPRLAAAITGGWADGRSESALGGHMQYAEVTTLRTPHAVDGLVAAASGEVPRASTSGVWAPNQGVFGWDGKGRLVDAQRSLDRLRHHHPDGVVVLAPSHSGLELGPHDTLMPLT